MWSLFSWWLGVLTAGLSGLTETRAGGILIVRVGESRGKSMWRCGGEEGKKDGERWVRFLSSHRVFHDLTSKRAL